MELKRVVSEETKYVTKKKMNEKILEKNILNKWKKLGITATIINIIMRNKVVAYSLAENAEPVELSALGAMPEAIPIPRILKISSVVILFITLFISGIYSVKKKKGSDKLKNLKITSIILLVVATLLCVSGFLIEMIFYTY